MEKVYSFSGDLVTGVSNTEYNLTILYLPPKTESSITHYSSLSAYLESSSPRVDLVLEVDSISFLTDVSQGSNIDWLVNTSPVLVNPEEITADILSDNIILIEGIKLSKTGVAVLAVFANDVLSASELSSMEKKNIYNGVTPEGGSAVYFEEIVVKESEEQSTQFGPVNSGRTYYVFIMPKTIDYRIIAKTEEFYYFSVTTPSYVHNEEISEYSNRLTGISGVFALLISLVFYQV